MDVSKLIKKLQEIQKVNPKAKILVGSDEEMNVVYTEAEIGEYIEEGEYIIYGLSGSEEGM